MTIVITDPYEGLPTGSTFLKLCQRVRQEAGITGTGPSTVLSQSGEYRRVVDWVASAWVDIQIAKTNWLWMVGEFSFVTTPGKREYTTVDAGIASRFSMWAPRTVRMGLTENDEQLLQPLSYDEYRAIYLTGPQPQSRPVALAVSPAQKLLLGYVPNDAFTVRGEYQKSPQYLTLDADVPEMPGQFHEAIVYMALMKYARYMAAGEVYEDAASNYQRIMNQLMVHQLPMITEAETLA